MDSRFPIGRTISVDELNRDPYPVYDRLLASEPVSYVPALELYFMTRYDDVCTILRDTGNFLVGTERSLVFDIFGTHMMTVEGDEHYRHKSAYRPLFLPTAIRPNLEPQIAAHVDYLIDDLSERSEVELREAFSSRLPVMTMLSLFGVDVGGLVTAYPCQCAGGTAPDGRGDSA